MSENAFCGSPECSRQIRDATNKGFRKGYQRGYAQGRLEALEEARTIGRNEGYPPEEDAALRGEGHNF